MPEPAIVAVIGCGWAGRRHAHAFQRAGAVVRWCVDLDRSRAVTLADAMPGAIPEEDYRRALADREVTAVSICLPHHLHTTASCEAAAAGKHVLCEKPLADTISNADRMIEAAATAGVILMVAENQRFSPILNRVGELLRNDAIGRPALAQMHRECYLSRSFLEERRWFLDARLAAGGIMMSGGIHDVDAMRALLGEIESIYALRVRQRFIEMEGDDTSIALVRFADGAAGTLVESFYMKSLATAAGSEVHSLRIDGDLGHLAVIDATTIRVFSEHPDFARGGEPVEHRIHVAQADTFYLEIAHFLHCLRTGEEPISSGRLQRRSLEVVLAAYHSMETAQPVRVLPTPNA